MVLFHNFIPLSNTHSHMLLRQFPNLAEVQKLGNPHLDRTKRPWRNVILNFKCTEAERKNIESPYSIFANLKGTSYVGVNGKEHRVESDSFLLTLPGDRYDLCIDAIEPTELFNIHINTDFLEQCANGFLISSNDLIHHNEKAKVSSLLLNNGHHPKTIQFNQLVESILRFSPEEKIETEHMYTNIVRFLLFQNTANAEKVAQLPMVKWAVRKEIAQRLESARDFMYDNYSTTFEIDELCREIGLSKFHFIRLFEAYFDCSPYKYLVRIRMQKACELLKNTHLQVNDIAGLVGFEFANSFIKTFKKQFGSTPQQYRNDKMMCAGK